MLRRVVVPFAFACASAFAGMAAAQATDGAMPAPGDVRGWLLKIHEAASRQNFQGTFVVTGGGGVASARIAHFAEGSNQFERIESLDGKQRNVYRHNDTVHTVWPASQVLMIEQRGLLGSFPALLQAGSAGIADWYELKLEGTDRVAGHEAWVLAVRGRDAYRHGYRLWAHRGTGLLLRADVVGERGDVLETSAFSDVAIGVKPEPQLVVSAMRKQDGLKVVRPTLTPTKLELQGWTMRQTAPGFREVSCVSRQIEASPDGSAAASEPPVLQAIYSDGLTYVSVFIEPFRKERHLRPVIAALGATLTLTERHGDWWITAIGDTPIATLKLFVGGLERRRP